MKTLPVIAIALLVVSPAFASSGKKKLRMHQGYHQSEQGWRNSRNSWNVYSGTGRFVGRDPSPNVRQRLRDDDMQFRNTF